jgi:hypothetical protein
MRTITTNTNVYEFRELPPEAQKKAIEAAQSDPYRLEYPWFDIFVEDFVTETLAKEGWDTSTNEVFFSGFSSQGDGACFDGSLNILTYLTYYKLTDKFPLITKLVTDGPYVWGKIHCNRYATYYSHERTRYFELDHDSEDTIRLDGGLAEDQLADFTLEIKALEKDIEDNRLQLAHELYRSLEKEYDYLNSDEYIIDDFINNDTEFTLDGKIWNQ